MATVNSKLAVIIEAQAAPFMSALNKAENRLDKFERKVTGLGAGLLAGFGLMEIGQQMIQVTSQFQKFEAVLTNTLGSQSAAQAALKNIKDFAATTPFEVGEITAAYVRWANQGLNPTIDRMQKLGDIASALGAEFEQTAEAFKDLAVGQTKRLEEIGISATQSNGKIQLSFKGVNLEIEKNAEGVQKALDVYSQLNGVLGTSDAVSKTLGGRISNLKDSWDQFMLVLGTSTSGPVYGIIQSLTTLLNAMSNLPQEMALIKQALNPFQDLSGATKETLDYLLKFGRTDSGKKVADVLEPLNKLKAEQFFGPDNFNKRQKEFVEILTREGESLEDVNVLWDFYIDKKRQAVIEGTKAKMAEEAAIKQREKDKTLQEQTAQYEALLERLKRYKEGLSTISVTQVPVERFARVTTGEVVFKERQEDPLLKMFGPERTEQIKGFLENVTKQVDAANARIKSSIDQLNQSFANAAGQGLMTFLTGLGDVAQGSMRFGDLIIKSLTSFMREFGSALIAIGIGKLGLDALFKTPAGAIAAITAGTALVALAGALNRSASASVSKIGSSGGGGGISGGMNMGAGYGNPNQNITITGRLVGSGRDLVAVIENTNFDNSIRKGG